MRSLVRSQDGPVSRLIGIAKCDFGYQPSVSKASSAPPDTNRPRRGLSTPEYARGFKRHQTYSELTGPPNASRHAIVIRPSKVNRTGNHIHDVLSRVATQSCDHRRAPEMHSTRAMRRECCSDSSRLRSLVKTLDELPLGFWGFHLDASDQRDRNRRVRLLLSRDERPGSRSPIRREMGDGQR
jgi:hypothetical protein